MNNAQAVMADSAGTPLKRTLSLRLLVLYGLGVTVGAGIYVLIGTTTARAGTHAPLAFLLAAVVMGLSGATFAELAGRLPHSAGEAAYVRAAFGSDRLALATGLLVLAVALVSAAAIAKGAGGYVAAFVPLPADLLALALIGLLGAIAAWGVREALSVAAVMTVIEVGGLLAIVTGAAVSHPAAMLHQIGAGLAVMPDLETVRGILGAFMLAFFAFIGFESLVNLAEEAHAPSRLIPRAIFATLALSTVLYVLVVTAAMVAVPADELAASATPLALVFVRATGAAPQLIAAIAVFATINGVIAQIILAARVIYGLARQGQLPALLGRVAPRTGTPLVATAVATGLTFALAAIGTLDQLADMTSRLMLAVFALVHAALIAIHRRGDPAPADVFHAPRWVPPAGFAACVLLLFAGIAFWG